MKAYALFQQYIWLVNTIHSAKKITLEDINKKWIKTWMSEGLPMVRSTFNRHKDAIEDMFGIYIECDRKDGFRYYIGNAEVLEEDSIQNWMLSTMSVSGMLSESKSVHDRILLETIPSNGEHLRIFIDAMKSSNRVHLTYHRYGAEYATEMIVDPFCVKIFNRRWYALVRTKSADSFFIVSLDRVMALEVTDEKFVMDEEFDASSWFKECYGIVRNEKFDLTRIRIRAFGREVYYLRDLPLHHSQKEVETADGYSDFELTLRPTPDFFTPLVARGAQIKIMEPQWIADEVRRIHQEAAELYD